MRGLDVDRGQAREPHRHDYHELLWLRSGSGRAPARRRPGGGAAAHASRSSAAARSTSSSAAQDVQRRDRALRRRAGPRRRRRARRPGGCWPAAAGARSPVPAGRGRPPRGVIAALGAETRPAARRAQRRARSATCSRSCCCGSSAGTTTTRTERRDADDAEVQLHRRFAELPRGRLRPPPRRRRTTPTRSASRAAALSRALAHVTGRSTKELVTDRVMLEAARLLRFTDLTVQEIATAAGLPRPAVLLARVQAPPRARRRMAYRDARAAGSPCIGDVVPFATRRPAARSCGP